MRYFYWLIYDLVVYGSLKMNFYPEFQTFFKMVSVTLRLGEAKGNRDVVLPRETYLNSLSKSENYLRTNSENYL